MQQTTARSCCAPSSLVDAFCWLPLSFLIFASHLRFSVSVYRQLYHFGRLFHSHSFEEGDCCWNRLSGPESRVIDLSCFVLSLARLLPCFCQRIQHRRRVEAEPRVSCPSKAITIAPNTTTRSKPSLDRPGRSVGISPIPFAPKGVDATIAKVRTLKPRRHRTPANPGEPLLPTLPDDQHTVQRLKLCSDSLLEYSFAPTSLAWLFRPTTVAVSLFLGVVATVPSRGLC